MADKHNNVMVVLTALLTVSDYALSAMNRGEIVLVAMLDCSKCFDTIDHATLLSILKLYGVVIKWFQSYLIVRSFSARAGYQRRQNLQIKDGEHFNRYLPGHGLRAVTF